MAIEPKSLDVVDLTVRYRDVTALTGVSFTVPPGEFISVLGPSGCGKSTLLRAIAGLEPAAAGNIAIGEREVGGLKPKERRVAFVFQSYALYPHMTCRQNIATPLLMGELSALGRLPLARLLSRKARSIHRSIDERVTRTAEQLEIAPLLDRRPGALSGGQRQRVALGRALIREPDLFLLDEPLANLDATLRNKTRSELRALQQRLGATTLFVTHDQAEAMAISDRVIVMFDGRIRQIGTPDDIYRHPADLDVARFLSQPHLNVVDAAVLRETIGTHTSEGPIVIAGRALDGIDGVVAFRPENTSLRRGDRPGLPGIAVTVDHAEHGGADGYVFVESGQTPLVVRLPSRELSDWPAGSTGVLHFDLAAAHVFDHAAGADRPARRAVA